MRTTVTLDSDVLALIRTAMNERRISFKEALNSAVRTGLTQSRRRGRSCTQKTFSLGSEQNFRWDQALQTAAAMEDEELSRKLELRK